MAQNNNWQQGFTLIELMVAIVIAAILLTMAVPSYQDFIKRNAVESLQSRFAAAVVTARTEAATRNTTTTLCASTDGATCAKDSTKWANGWLVILDPNANSTLDTGDEVILSYTASGNYPVYFKGADTVSIHSISFTNQGFTKNQQRAFATVCEPAKVSKYTRGLTIERSGRVMKSRDSNNDNVHDFMFDAGDGSTPTATNLSCP